MTGIILWFKQRTCQHEFKLADLKTTNIPEPANPGVNDRKAWEKYLEELYHGESFRKRVTWPCCKCGKVFYAHCGLDIVPENGYIIR